MPIHELTVLWAEVWQVGLSARWQQWALLWRYKGSTYSQTHSDCPRIQIHVVVRLSSCFLVWESFFASIVLSLVADGTLHPHSQQRHNKCFLYFESLWLPLLPPAGESSAFKGSCDSSGPTWRVQATLPCQGQQCHITYSWEWFLIIVTGLRGQAGHLRGTGSEILPTG